MKRKLFHFHIFLIFVLCLSSCYNRNGSSASNTSIEIPITESTYNLFEDDLSYPIQINEYSETGELLKEIFYSLDSFGSVKENRRYEYHYDSLGNLTLVNVFNSDSSTPKEYKYYRYDESNRLTKYYVSGILKRELSYDDNGNTIYDYIYSESGELIDSTTYVYHNNLIASKLYMSKELEEYEDIYGCIRIKEHVNYILEEYNEVGQVTKVTYYGSGYEPYYECYTYLPNKEICVTKYYDGSIGSILTICYDDLGRRLKYEINDANGRLSSLHQYEYQDNTEIVYDINEDGTVNEIIKTIYNDAGYQTYQATYDSQWNQCFAQEYEYDSHGYLVHILSIREDGSVEEAFAPERQFNSCGIVIKETFYSDVIYIATAYMEKFPQLLFNESGPDI